MGGGGGDDDENGSIDYTSLRNRQKVADDNPVDDGSGDIKVWRIEDFETVPVEDEGQIGQFYDGDSYIVLYTYEIPPSDEKHHILYFWQGRNSTADERGASAVHAVRLDDELGGSPVQIRVTMGREPSHFRSIFASRGRGGMIVHLGGVASGFRNRDDVDTYDEDGCRLYHVKGTTIGNTYAVAVEETASSLNSSDCFVLVHHGKTTLWTGSCSNDAEREAASAIASRIASTCCGDGSSGDDSVTLIMEGEEGDEFWDALGGKADYPRLRPEEPQPSEPRLFECSDALGEFQMSEVTPFAQEDLNDDAVMILDCGAGGLFVWIGSKSNADERSKAAESGRRYLEASPEGHDHGVQIVTVQSGSEPPMFTQYFVGWDAYLLEKTAFVDPYERRLAEREAEEEAEEAAAAAARGEEEEEQDAAVDGEESSTPAGDVDDGINPAHREAALSDEEFEAAFGMTKSEFYDLPNWRQVAKKKEVGLF